MNDFNQSTILINFEKKEDMMHMQLQAVCKNGDDVQQMDGGMLLNFLAAAHNQVLQQINKQVEESKLDVPSVPQEVDTLPEDESTADLSDESDDEEVLLVPTTTTLQ